MLTAATAELAAHGLVGGSVLQSGPLRVLAAFVTINTVMYSALALAKILPKVYPATWFPSRNRRAEDRSIYPAGWDGERGPGTTPTAGVPAPHTPASRAHATASARVDTPSLR